MVKHSLLARIIALFLFVLISHAESRSHLLYYEQEQESRTDFLRSKAKKRRIDQGNDEESPKDVVVHKSGGHLNFFEEVEDGVSI